MKNVIVKEKGTAGGRAQTVPVCWSVIFYLTG